MKKILFVILCVLLTFTFISCNKINNGKLDDFSITIDENIKTYTGELPEDALPFEEAVERANNYLNIPPEDPESTIVNVYEFSSDVVVSDNAYYYYGRWYKFDSKEKTAPDEEDFISEFFVSVNAQMVYFGDYDAENSRINVNYGLAIKER